MDETDIINLFPNSQWWCSIPLLRKLHWLLGREELSFRAIALIGIVWREFQREDRNFKSLKVCNSDVLWRILTINPSFFQELAGEYSGAKILCKMWKTKNGLKSLLLDNFLHGIENMQFICKLSYATPWYMLQSALDYFPDSVQPCCKSWKFYLGDLDGTEFRRLSFCMA